LRKNYVLIDFENIQPESVDALAEEPFHVIVFIGANQRKVPFDIVRSLQRMGERAEYVQINGNGPNALDFHIAFYIGKLAGADSTAYFHIISRDAGFDPLIEHLKKSKIYACRRADISDIPLVKANDRNKLDAHLEAFVQKLREGRLPKPRTTKTLSNAIAAWFHKQLGDNDIASLVTGLEANGYIKITKGKVSYTLSNVE
jgi:hypothetical protein